jgi:cell fate regulator YaaT (PSP1 superfamily)
MRSYLVQHGLSAWLGKFRVVSTLTLSRGDEVVIRSLRGFEVGLVLDELPTGSSSFSENTGEILRAISVTDREVSQQQQKTVEQILQQAQTLAEERELPLLFLDGEILLDGSRAILHAIHHAECDASPLFEQLSERFGIPVMLHDLTTQAQPVSTGCGKPGCGSEGGGCSSCSTEGGCSTGSCSRGKVSTAEDLTKYFAGLREQMETARSRIPLS